jgi:hypothetical protein
MRLIDADELTAKIDTWDESARNGTNPNCKNGNEYEAAMDICIMVEESPTVDAIPVVRCRECKHRYYYDDDEHDPVCTASMAYASTPDDWFCKDGQRKDDACAEIVKVSYCRDCLYRGNSFTGCPKLHGLETPDNFFCKYGKPKN